MRKTTADLIVRPRRPSDDGFIYWLSDRIFAEFSFHPTGSMASMLAERGAIVRVAERGLNRAGSRASAALEESAGSRRDPYGGVIAGHVARSADLPVGFFVLGFERLARSFGPWQHPAVARLNAIGVQPDLQGRGVGRFLLDRAEALARDEGAVSLTLMTAETNTRARRLFVAAGFQRFLTLEHAYARGQRGIVMAKPL